MRANIPVILMRTTNLDSIRWSLSFEWEWGNRHHIGPCWLTQWVVHTWLYACIVSKSPASVVRWNKIVAGLLVSSAYCTPNQKLACFVLYLKIINTFLKDYIYASYSKFYKELKTGIETLVSVRRPSGFEVMDQNSQNVVKINIHLRIAQPTFLGQFTIRCIYHFQKDVNFEIQHKTR